MHALAGPGPRLSARQGQRQTRPRRSALRAAIRPRSELPFLRLTRSCGSGCGMSDAGRAAPPGLSEGPCAGPEPGGRAGPKSACLAQPPRGSDRAANVFLPRNSAGRAPARPGSRPVPSGPAPDPFCRRGRAAGGALRRVWPVRAGAGPRRTFGRRRRCAVARPGPGLADGGTGRPAGRMGRAGSAGSMPRRARAAAPRSGLWPARATRPVGSTPGSRAPARRACWRRARGPRRTAGGRLRGRHRPLTSRSRPRPRCGRYAPRR